MTLVIFLGLLFSPAQAEVLLNQEEALQLAFPDSKSIIRHSLFLRADEIQTIEQKAKSKLDSEYFAYYTAKSSAGSIGYAFFDTHIVRTMPETLMIVLNCDGSINFVEILAFHEPKDYRPPPRWLKLLSHKKLTQDLWIKRGLRNITGATLSTQAIAESTRRILAIYEVAIKNSGG